MSTLKATLTDLLAASLASAQEAGALVSAQLPDGFVVERPKDDRHGHLATNVAMVLARPERNAPRKIAEALLEHLTDPDNLVKRAEIAGPGFINFTFHDRVWQRVLAPLLEAGERYGFAPARGEKVNVEFVSANPTGPLHIGHARGAFTGDATARLLEAAGYEVTREYYVNDAGNQVDTLGRSTLIRYQQALGVDVELPEDHYPGDYILPIAAIAQQRFGDAYKDADPFVDGDWLPLFRDLAIEVNLADIKRVLAAMNVHVDVWQSEREMVAGGAVERAIDALEARGDCLHKDADGKLWFKSTLWGDDKDRVVIRDDGRGTYFASDIAYHKQKLDRGFSRILDVWGADHGGYVKRVEAALAALGLPSERFEALLVQMVSLVKNGEAFKIGKRSGTMILLEELVAAVGPDVARYLFLMRRSDAQYEFDIGLAESKSLENPVYYVQYGHARLHAILRRGVAEGLAPCGPNDAALELLTHPDEIDLLQRMAQWPEFLQAAAEALEPHRVTTFLAQTVAAFHSYYTRNRKTARVIDAAAPELSSARLLLCQAMASTLRTGLSLLGVDAPERMDPLEPRENAG
jgi:arginyl-tRNA synthetase